MAITRTIIGILESEAGKPIASMESFQDAHEILQKLAHDDPKVTDFQSRLSASQNNIGTLHSKAGRPAEAMEWYRRALVIQRKLADDNPRMTGFRKDLGMSLDNIAWDQLQAGEMAESLVSYREAGSIRRKLAEDDLDVKEYQSDLASSQTNLADVLRRLGQTVEAREGYARAIVTLERMVEITPDETMFRRSNLASSVRRLGLVRLGAGDVVNAVTDARRAGALLEGLPSRSENEWFELACCHAALAAAAGREGSGISAVDGESEAARSLDLLRRAVANGFRDVGTMKREVALDLLLLAQRPDFQLLMMDLAFPAKPFAK